MSNEVLIAIVGGLFSIVAALIAAMWGQNNTRITKLEQTSDAQDTVDRQQGERLAKLEERSNNHETNLSTTVNRIDYRLNSMETKLDRAITGIRSSPFPPGPGTYGSGRKSGE